ncbi:MAG: hypothetical protein LBR74_00530 [Eubacterium sp.]|jgi:hypothetical protein|nr:hypothetical protein [Eubacterium sp.]
MIIRTYRELSRLKTIEERFKYLKLNGVIGEETFGFDRFINQKFYKSQEWLSARDNVIIRDNGCDLGVDGYDICGKIIIHHMNPILLEDIEMQSGFLLNPDYLICATLPTHNAIHYGDGNLLVRMPTERTKDDTCPWRHR